MNPDPKRPEDEVDPLSEQLHEAEKQDPVEKTDDEGEPFDGNFA